MDALAIPLGRVSSKDVIFPLRSSTISSYRG
jgi:hypothetical protein